MARGITEKDVLEAADALLSRGERPTIERVRLELGRGSPNTVNRHLDAWWASLAERIKGRAGSTLPAALLELCARLYAGVVKQAHAEALAQLAEGEARLHAERVQLEALRASQEIERAGATATAERMSEEMAALRARNETLAAEKATLAAEADRLTSAAEKAEADSHATRASLESAQAKHQVEVERVRRQWQGNEGRWLKEIDHLRDEAKSQRARHQNEVKALQAKLKAAERELSVAIKARADAETELRRKENALAKEREARLQAEAANRATKEAVDAFRRGVPATKRRPRPSSSNGLSET